MIMFARFDEIPAMTFQDIKEQNITNGLQHGQTDNVKTVYPSQSLLGGIMKKLLANLRPWTYQSPLIQWNWKLLAQVHSCAS